MSTSGELEGALTGGLWHYYFDALASSLTRSDGGDKPPRDRTFDDVFAASRERYMSECSFVVVDKVCSVPATRPVACLVALHADALLWQRLWLQVMQQWDVPDEAVSAIHRALAEGAPGTRDRPRAATLGRCICVRAPAWVGCLHVCLN